MQNKKWVVNPSNYITLNSEENNPQQFKNVYNQYMQWPLHTVTPHPLTRWDFVGEAFSSINNDQIERRMEVISETFRFLHLHLTCCCKVDCEPCNKDKSSIKPKTDFYKESFASISSKLNPFVSGTFRAMNSNANKPMIAKSKNVPAVPIVSCSQT